MIQFDTITIGRRSGGARLFPLPGYEAVLNLAADGLLLFLCFLAGRAWVILLFSGLCFSQPFCFFNVSGVIELRAWGV
jgi:hypothetical protein